MRQKLPKALGVGISETNGAAPDAERALGRERPAKNPLCPERNDASFTVDEPGLRAANGMATTNTAVSRKKLVASNGKPRRGSRR